MTAFDAVIIGSGINGLIAAAELGRAGWSVAVVERNAELGGFIAAGAPTAPGYVHDTYSSWHPEFVTGGGYAALGEELHAHGLVYRNADGAVTATVRQDGRVVVAHRDPEVTAERFAAHADRASYVGALARTGADLPALGALLGGELRSASSVRPTAQLAKDGGARGLERRLRDVAMSGRAWAREHFRGDEVDALWIPWLLHAGLSPDHASGGFMLPVFAATIHAAGLPVVEGGQGRFLAAWRGVLAAHGVELFCGEAAERVVVTGGRATGVVTPSRTLTARRAVLASVAPSALYERLLAPDEVPAPVRAAAARYRPGRAAMQLHVALSAPVGWREAELEAVPLVHLSDGSASTAIACAEAEAGLLPRRATVVVGQQSTLDPSRAPAGAATLWIQLQELPGRPVGDAAGELDATRGWTPELGGAYAERILARIEEHAPGLRDRVVGLDVITPPDLEAHNPNAIGGDPYGGATDLDQRLLWRPFREAAQHATSIAGLWHIGAATHPGPGLNGASGHMVAQALLRPPRRARVRKQAGRLAAAVSGARR
jgi:phytoene dehydrogenase-like protein